MVDGLFWEDIELTEEDEEEVIRKTAEVIHRFGLDAAAILMIESIKPLAYIGGQIGRFLISPFLPAISEDLGRKGDIFLRVFEKRENVEKLLKLLEEMAGEEEGKPLETSENGGEEHRKRGWRRLIPFL
ncbi:MAG TPA: hypothetical protein ENF89_01385 [Candidatus Bathyarchaeota archaeon]|nr:hypothetical protein [Candidatus Bathyarchaeota archaeon]